MKELSIEEKAQRYDEAIERAKDINNEKRAQPFNVMTRVFPELKESESERIKGAAIEFVRQNKSFNYCLGISKEEVIAWLEKQGKNNMGISEATKKELENNLNKALKKETPESCNEFLEKQGGQKPDEPKFKVKYAGSEYNVLEIKEIAGVTYYGIEDEPNHIDYVLPDNCEIVSGYGIKENGSPYPTKPAVFSEQNPTWSEEDETFLNTTIAYLKDAKEFKKTAENCIDWLKSLKDRYTWKPTEEQMDALDYYANSLCTYCDRQDDLRSLFNDLKKL